MFHQTTTSIICLFGLLYNRLTHIPEFTQVLQKSSPSPIFGNILIIVEEFIWWSVWYSISQRWTDQSSI